MGSTPGADLAQSAPSPMIAPDRGPFVRASRPGRRRRTGVKVARSQRIQQRAAPTGVATRTRATATRFTRTGSPRGACDKSNVIRRQLDQVSRRRRGRPAEDPLTAAPHVHTQAFFAPQPLDLLVVHDPAPAASVVVGTSMSPPRVLPGVGPQPGTQPRIGVLEGVGPGVCRWVDRFCPTSRQARRSLTSKTRRRW